MSQALLGIRLNFIQTQQSTFQTQQSACERRHISGCRFSPPEIRLCVRRLTQQGHPAKLENNIIFCFPRIQIDLYGGFRIRPQKIFVDRILHLISELLVLRKYQLTLFCTLNDTFVPLKTIGTNKSSCYESPRWCSAKEISFLSPSLPSFFFPLFRPLYFSLVFHYLNAWNRLSFPLQLNPNASADFRPSEQIFPDMQLHHNLKRL